MTPRCRAMAPKRKGPPEPCKRKAVKDGLCEKHLGAARRARAARELLAEVAVVMHRWTHLDEEECALLGRIEAELNQPPQSF
jgi:hypothetical protein